MEEHWYYLHENGQLIHKVYEPESDSPFVRRVWRVNLQSRQDAWTVLIEACSLGGNIERIMDLAAHWQCDGEDLTNYIVRVTPTPELKKGIDIFLSEVLKVNPEEYWNWLARTPKGHEPDFSTMPR